MKPKPSVIIPQTLATTHILSTAPCPAGSEPAATDCAVKSAQSGNAGSTPADCRRVRPELLSDTENRALEGNFPV